MDFLPLKVIIASHLCFDVVGRCPEVIVWSVIANCCWVEELHGLFEQCVHVSLQPRDVMD